MAGGGPLIPGLTEFDRPKGRKPAWIGWVIGIVLAAIALVVLAGFVGGVGPLRMLGTESLAVQPVSYRGAADANSIDVSVAVPASGLCREDELSVVAYERSNRIEVEASVSRPKSGQCTPSSLSGDLQWASVPLNVPLGQRAVIRLSDREPLPRA